MGRRVLAAIPLLFLVSVLSFALIRSLPGDPMDVLLANAQKDMAPATVEAMREEMGLNGSLPQQYFRWAGAWFTGGELGRSYKDGRPVLAVIGERVPATLTLVGTSLVVAFLAGTAWGLIMVWLRFARYGAITESFLAALALTLYSAPGFWLGCLALSVVVQTSWLGWVPVLGLHDPGDTQSDWKSALSHLFLPAIVLSSRRSAKVALFVRALTIEEMSREYTVTALAKGLSQFQTIVRHVMRNCLLPLVNLLGLSLPALLGGSVLIETVFAWPGLGRLAVDATFGRNYPVLMALVMIYGTLVIASNLLADMLVMLIDPRVRQANQE